jgi:hypothetical protein
MATTRRSDHVQTVLATRRAPEPRRQIGVIGIDDGFEDVDGVIAKLRGGGLALRDRGDVADNARFKW